MTRLKQVTWLKKGSRLAQFAVIAIAAGEISAVAAEVLVLRSVGPSARRYPVGQRLPDNTTFALRPGDTVAVLVRGGTRSFRGPGTFSATGPARSTQLGSAGPRVNTGVQRGDLDRPTPMPTDVWQHDVTRSERVCVPAGTRPTLWRPSSADTVQITITPQSGRPQTLSWSRGQSTLPWPAAIPITDGASYQLNWTGAATPSRFTARTIQALPAGDVEGLFSALLSNQCRGQTDLLIARHDLDRAAEAPTGGGAAQ